MATFGRVDIFNPEVEDWVTYSERLEQYFIANDIKENEKQRAILLSAVGAKSYQLIRNLVRPNKPTDKSYKQLVEILQEHHCPKPSPIVQRFKFNTRCRQSTETVGDYVAELRHLSEFCEYGNTLDDMLRDRVVVGINNDPIQNRLLSERTLTFAKALDISQAMETAAKNAVDLRASQSGFKNETVHKVQNKQYAKRGPPTPQYKKSEQSHVPCYRCGEKHSPDTCRYKEAECHYCHKKGHISPVCNSKIRDKKAKSMQFVKNKKYSSQGVNQVKVSLEQESYTMFSIGASPKSSDPYHTDVQINGSVVTMEIDTGASVSIFDRVNSLNI